MSDKPMTYKQAAAVLERMINRHQIRQGFMGQRQRGVQRAYFIRWPAEDEADRGWTDHFENLTELSDFLRTFDREHPPK